MLKKYGHRHALQAEQFNKKFRDTIGNKTTKPERFAKSLKKRIDTMQQKYGCDNIMHCEEGLQKQKQAVKEKYGVEYASQNPLVKEKHRKTIEAKVSENPDYWDDKKNKRARTYLKKYGTEHPQKDMGLGLQKRKNTHLRKYGVEWYTQTHECHKSRKKHLQYGNLAFDSLWEKKVYQFCKEHGIACEYQPDISFNYTCHGTTHVYKPDFRINGVLYEVKGDQFFRVNESTGEEEMYCPFRGRNMSDSEYELLCERYEAKHKCIRENGIRILRGKDIANLEKVFL